MEVDGEKIRILLIEDNPGDARLIRELLSAEEGASFFLEHADRLSTGLARLAQGNIDVILLDLSLPDSHGLEGLNKICAQVPKVPVVVLSGLSDEAVAINAVQEGAQDYLVKGSVDSALLVRSLRYAIERQYLRVALRESESRYRLLADNAADLIWTANMKWEITYVSPSVKRLLGYTVEEMKRLAITDILTPDSLKQASRFIRNQMDIMTPGLQHQSLSLTLEHVRKDGSTLWAEVMLSFLWDKDGKLSEILGVTREITERKKAEEALRQSEQRYRLLAENVKDIIWTRDMNLNTTYVSPSVLEVSGYSVDEVMSMSLEESLTPASLELIRPVLAKVLAVGEKGQGDLPEVIVLDVELIHKDGSITPVEMKVNLLRNSDGQPTGFLGVTRDITERKKAEEALRESQEELQAIFDNARDGIALFDLEGRLLKVNKRVVEVGGYTMDEVAGKTFDLLKMFTSESIERMFTAKDMVSSGKEVPVLECEACTKSGRKLNLEIHVSPFFLKGKRLGSVAIMRDTTERKKAEDALRESEARFRTVFEGTGLGIALVDFNGKTLSVNLAFEHVLGYNMEEFAEIASSLKYLHPEDSMVDAELYLEMVKGKREHYTIDKRYIRKDGGVIWGRQNLSIVRDASGKPKYFIAMIEDITEGKRIEEALRQSEERYRELVENANDIIYTHDLAGNFTSINKAGEQVTGYRRDEVLAMSISHILPPESLEQARQMIARKISDGGQTRYELEIVTKDKHKVLLEVNTRLIYEGGKPVGTQGIARDITERKKMEQELLRLSDAVRMSADSIVITDLEGNIVDINKAALKMQGARGKSDLIGLKYSGFMSTEEQEKALRDLSRLIEEGHINDIQYRISTKDGKMVLVETNASLMRGRNGEPVGIVAVTRDITERKEMEEALKRSEYNYRILFESTIDGMIVFDAETWKVMIANQTALRMLGFGCVEDVIGANILDLIYPDDRDRISRIIMENEFGRGLDELREFRAITRDGRQIWLSVMGTRIEYEGKMADLVSARDITERKRMEEDKQKMEEQLRLAGRLAAVGELAAGIGHELNNPIAAIQGFAQFLTARKDLDETTRKDLDTIYRESQRAAKITQNLLSFARRHEPEKHLISLNEAVEKTLELQAHPMKVNNIELVVELAPDLPKTLADFHQMQRVFVNIINNAEQAMVEAHGKGRLVVKTQKVRNMIQISFADDGPGISEENIKRIFDPFFTTKEVGKGTGLGLSICYGLVEAHGGRIYARSKLGQGATFVVEIPIVFEDQLVAEAALINPGSRGVKWKKPKG
jgi:two-component system NtrC family sensor kinase